MCKLEQENMQKFRLHARAQVGVANQNERPGIVDYPADRSLKDLPSRSIRIPTRDCSLLLGNGDFELGSHESAVG
jgi:hypothetical protein